MTVLTDSFGEVSSLSSSGRIRTLPRIRSYPVYPYSGEKLKSTRVLKTPTAIQQAVGKVLSKSAAFREPPDTRTLFKPSYYPISVNSDFIFEVVGQNTDASTHRYTVDSIFTENNPNASYVWSKQSPVSTSTKTLYFYNRNSFEPFKVGETVRIRNINGEYSEFVTVTAVTYNSISYNSSNLLPETSGTYIDSGSTLYRFRTYDRTTATVSATNFFNSVIAPGKRGVSTFYVKGQSLISAPDSRNVSKISFPTPTYKGVEDLRRLPHRISSVSQYRSDGNQSIVYLPAKFITFKTAQIASVVDSRDTQYLGRTAIPLKALSYNTQLTTLEKRVTSLKDVDANLKSVQGLNVAKFNDLFVLFLPENSGIYKINTYKIGDFVQLKNVETLGKKIQNLKSDTINFQTDLMQKASMSIKGFDNVLYDLKPTYVRTYKYTPLTEVVTIKPPSRIILPLKGIQINLSTETLKKGFTRVVSPELNTVPQNLNKKFIVVKDVPYRLSVNKFSQRLNTIGIVNNLNVYNLAQQDLDSSGLPSDYSFAITDQTLNQLSNYYYSSNTIFTENNPDESYIWSRINRSPPLAQPTTKTFYFNKPISLNAVDIGIGEKIRIRNSVTGRSVVETVVASSSNSVTIAMPSNPIMEIANTFIDFKYTLYPQSFVRTTTAPVNAKENLYYATMARGFRSNAVYIQTSFYASVGSNYATANISANISQSTVSTTVAPTSPREVLYYVNLARGVRNNAAYNRTSFYSYINTNSSVANISANISQSTVSTTVAPTNPREVLYYVNLAKGLRNKAYYIRTSEYATIGNNYSLANISANISQSSVSTTTAPINARENLYYSILAKGFRSNAVYNTASKYADIDNQSFRSVNLFTAVKRFYNELPISFGINTLSLYSPINNLNPTEFSIEVTGQNLDTSISRYTIDSIFTENNPNESYIWNKQSFVSSATKTLYFPNQQNQKFFTGDVVKIRNSNSGYVDYVYVIAATTNSITYTSSNLLPEISGTFIESGATVYNKFLSTAIGPTPLKNFNLSVIAPGRNAIKTFGYGQNFASSSTEVANVYNIRKQVPSFAKGDVPLDFTTKIRSVSVLKKDPNLFDVDNIDIQKIRNVQQFDLPSNYATEKLKSISFLKTSPVSFVVNDMKRFDPDSSSMPSDFSLAVIDQSLNQFSNYYYDTDTIFVESNVTNSYIWSRINRSPPTSSPTTKTLFFTNQRTLRFAPGEKVRVRNVTTGRSTLETVVACTFDSVTISLPSTPITETANTFIDSGFTTYSQNSVRTSVQPINARERFYYATIAKGFRSITSYPRGTSYADTASLNNTVFSSTNNARTGILRPVYADNYQRSDIIVRFKTGDFKRGSNGTQDPAAIKKAPVQFWS